MSNTKKTTTKEKVSNKEKYKLTPIIKTQGRQKNNVDYLDKDVSLVIFKGSKEGLTDKNIKFCEGILMGKSVKYAYAESGMEGDFIKFGTEGWEQRMHERSGNAYVLYRSDKIQKYIIEARQKLMEFSKIDVNYLLAETLQILEECKNKTKGYDANIRLKTLDRIASLLGLYQPDRKEIELKGVITEEELKKLIFEQAEIVD